jgi:L-lactate dehydrogenase complex protein LldF
VLTPLLTGVLENPSLPYASTLCGACFDACPVRIDIPSLLVHLRARHTEQLAEQRVLPSPEAALMTVAAWVMSSPRLFAWAGRAARAGRLLARRGRIRRLPRPLSAWTSTRDAPAPPALTFREWWRRRARDAS